MSRDPRVENWLGTMEVEWRYEESVPCASINKTASAMNPGRLGVRLDPSFVDLYAQSMMAGAQFPAIILAQTQSQGLIVVTGLHRLSAADKIERKTFDAYILSVHDVALLDTLIRSANSIEGYGVGPEERLEQAKFLVRKYDLSKADVARRFGLAESTLNHALTLDQTRENLARVGVDVARLKQIHLYRLAPLHNLNIAKAAAQIATDYNLTEDELEEVIFPARKATTEADALLLLGKARMEIAKTHSHSKGRGPRAAPPLKSRLIGCMRMMERLVSGNGGNPLSKAMTNLKDIEEMEIRVAQTFELVTSKINEAKRALKRSL